MTKQQIIVATIRDGNVSRISRHLVTTARGATRLMTQNSQLWMTRETATILGASVETFWGKLGNTEIQIKTLEVMEKA